MRSDPTDYFADFTNAIGLAIVDEVAIRTRERGED